MVFVILLNLGNKFSFISTNTYGKLFDIISDLSMIVDVTNYHAYNSHDSKQNKIIIYNFLQT